MLLSKPISWEPADDGPVYAPDFGLAQRRDIASISEIVLVDTVISGRKALNSTLELSADAEGGKRGYEGLELSHVRTGLENAEIRQLTAKPARTCTIRQPIRCVQRLPGFVLALLAYSPSPQHRQRQVQLGAEKDAGHHRSGARTELLNQAPQLSYAIFQDLPICSQSPCLYIPTLALLVLGLTCESYFILRTETSRSTRLHKG
ncbi:hypothetical protein B0T17DRAFT_511857 [Bombardia bombarda]|uniref:Uncharacterized protein n=1 Tax=Bombardia bombarda TaxID=252184 RepID=A0AA39U1A3_9PEZI|nr:hypothetical protein B0T17DRAFT_511857 [Bombardia bombarda]